MVTDVCPKRADNLVGVPVDGRDGSDLSVYLLRLCLHKVRGGGGRGGSLDSVTGDELPELNELLLLRLKLPSEFGDLRLQVGHAVSRVERLAYHAVELDDICMREGPVSPKQRREQDKRN